MPLGFHHSKLPGKGPFTWFCAIFVDVYEIPFPGIVLPSTPWIGGYVASPILFWVFAYGPLSTTFSAQPLLRPWGPFEMHTNDEHWIAQARLGLASMYIFHFVRRLLESIFLNKYTTQTRRMSDVELSYYAMWGCLCGFSGSATMMSKYGVVSPTVFMIGVTIWLVGQVTNAYCHYLLQVLKSQEKGVRMIPHAFPFNWFVMPHYTAEMISWAGFGVCSGLNTASITIWLLSLFVLQVWTHSRRMQYIKMHKNGQIPKGQDPMAYDPAQRWGVLPGLERI